MKRIFAVLLCFLCIGFCACSFNKEPFAAVNSSDINFNNLYWPNDRIWAFGHDIFYKKDDFYNMGVYWSADGNQSKLFRQEDFSGEAANPIESYAILDFFVCDTYLYFTVHNEEYTLYRYDLTEKTYTPVYTASDLYRRVVVGNRFIYWDRSVGPNSESSPLRIYDLENNTTTTLCESIVEFGIVKGQLQYITCSENTYTLYQYEESTNRSILLGAFACEFEDKYDIFNFTPERIVMMNGGKDYNRSIVVYTISTHSTAVYPLPKGIHNMVAYDRYAYAVLYDAQENSSDAIPSEENGIYRISLADGSYRRIEDGNDRTKLHVVSDDCFYIIQGELNTFSRYHRHIYQFHYPTGDKEKMLVI